MTGPVVVVGASGQVGGALLARLGSRGVGTLRRPHHGERRLDLEEVAAAPAAATAALAGTGAEVVCIAAGFTHVDGCEREPARAEAVNRDGPAVMARASAAAGARTVYLSTEYVFDGDDGPYDEDAPVAPLSVYGRTKREGEIAVLAADPAALVVRTTVVYGPEAQGKNAAYQLARRLRAGETVLAPADQVTTPTYNHDLAAAIMALVDRGATGVVNVAGPERLDRARFARRLAAAMGLDPGPVKPVTTAELGQDAPRPLQAGLTTDLLGRLVPGLDNRSLEAAVVHWAATTNLPTPVPWSGPPGCDR